MKAWRLDKLGGKLTFEEVPMPEVRPGSVLVKIQAAPLLSYLKPYIEGKLKFYRPPQGAFTPGTNGAGTIEAVGRDVWHLKAGQRVLLSPHFVVNENVDQPAQILIGLTAMGDDSMAVQADWRDGTLAEYALVPAASVTPAEDLDNIGAAQLAVMSRFIVPFGGLLRGRLAIGEILLVNGATGAYGTAAVLLGVALGAERVIAAGRSEAALEAVARAGGKRVTAVRLRGNIQSDTAALRTAAGIGAHIAIDMVGQANDPNATLASLHSLRRTGRLVLMGSMNTPLPLPYGHIVRNDLEVIGQFMYPASAYRHLLVLLRDGLLDISPIQPVTFPLGALTEAADTAARASNLECVVMLP